MLNKNSEDQLINILTASVNDYKINKNFQTIAKRLQKRISVGKLSEIFSRDIPFDMLSTNELYFMSKELNVFLTELNDEDASIKPEDINPEKYFTKVEIERFEGESEISDTVEEEKVIVLHNVIETIKGKQWICGKSSAEQITSIINKGLVKYDYRMQRETSKIKVNGKWSEKAKVFKKSVKEIANSMIEGNYAPTAISFNILNKDGIENFVYDEETLTMIITKDENTEISIIDGYHRCLACASALNVKPDLNQPMQINVFNYNISEARHYISQEGKKNALSESLLKFYDTSNAYNFIAKALGEEGNRKTNRMFENVGAELLDVQNLNKFTTFEILQIAISDNFKIKDDDLRERRILKQYLINFFNELISIQRDDFNNVKLSRKDNYISNHNTFYGYIALASSLYGKEGWEEKLFETVQKIDFSKTNSIWKEFNIEKDKLTAKPKKAIYDYFKNLVKEIESEAV